VSYQSPPGQYPQQQPPPPYGQWPPQQQYGWGPQTGLPAKKKGGAGKALLIVLGVAVLGTAGISALSAALKHHDHSSAGMPFPTTTYSPTYEPSEEPSAQPPSVKPTRPVVTPKPTVAKPTASRPTAPRAKPKPEPSDLDIVARNKLYKAGTMGSVNCKESKARPATAAGARANYANLARCLNRAWPALVVRAGARFRPPTVLSFSGTVESPCGSMSDTGPPFYCPTNQTIYMNLSQDIGDYNQDPAVYNRVWARMWMLHQFAHEYGHHVQTLTGIFQANVNLRYEAPNQALELQGSRRLELQASCFGDIFISSNKRSYPLTGESLRQWKWLIGDTIDRGHDHGSTANHKYWALKGYDSRGPAACNTFTASGAKVS
jgi:predicted metalloprotease